MGISLLSTTALILFLASKQIRNEIPTVHTFVGNFHVRPAFIGVAKPVSHARRCPILKAESEDDHELNADNHGTAAVDEFPIGTTTSPEEPPPEPHFEEEGQHADTLASAQNVETGHVDKVITSLEDGETLHASENDHSTILSQETNTGSSVQNEEDHEVATASSVDSSESTSSATRADNIQHADDETIVLTENDEDKSPEVPHGGESVFHDGEEPTMLAKTEKESSMLEEDQSNHDNLAAGSHTEEASTTSSSSSSSSETIASGNEDDTSISTIIQDEEPHHDVPQPEEMSGGVVSTHEDVLSHEVSDQQHPIDDFLVSINQLPVDGDSAIHDSMFPSSDHGAVIEVAQNAWQSISDHAATTLMQDFFLF